MNFPERGILYQTSLELFYLDKHIEKQKVLANDINELHEKRSTMISKRREVVNKQIEMGTQMANSLVNAGTKGYDAYATEKKGHIDAEKTRLEMLLNVLAER